ncbi:MAG: hypothetical protein ACI8VT_002237 [Saprospiraceae bacterium]|jgi:hypothetical protein
MRYIVSSFFVLISLISTAQTKPDFFPEDLNLESSEGQIRCYCKPGVRYNSPSRGLELSYGLISAGTYEPENGSDLIRPYSAFDRWQQFEANLKVPLILKEDFKMLLGYKYYSEAFSFSHIGVDFNQVFQNLDNQTLKKNAFSLIINKALNEKNYLLFRARYLSNGNYKGWLKLGGDYAIYNFVGLYAFKPNEDLEWGIGVNVSRSFRRTAALPFLVYNKTFNRKWGIESVFPAFVFGRYNFNTNNILLFGFEYNSDSYRMKFEDEFQQSFDYAFNHSELISAVRLEHRFADWVWANLKVGYQTNFSSDFESKSTEPSFFVEPTDGLYFHFGIFISPPDDHDD